MRSIAIILFVLLMPISVHAATCSAGYYVDNGQCVVCNPYRTPYYCPGDDTRYPCPTTDTDYDVISGYHYLVGFSPLSGQRVGEATAAREPARFVHDCVGRMYFSDNYGSIFLIEGYYDGNDYWQNNNKLWYVAGDGYYLSGYRGTSWENWYATVKPCTNPHPANSHYSGPGTPDSVDGTIVDANDCPWACDDGYGLHGNECLPLCTAGPTRLNVGNGLSFNLYRDRITSPSINIMFVSGTVCYIGVATGAGKLNIGDGTNVWHATN